MQKNRHILLISSDNFIIGLLKGYCVANHLILNELSSFKVLQQKDIDERFQLIIIDIRKPCSTITKSNLKLLRHMSCDYHIPICAVRDHTNDQLSETEAWIDCFFEDPIIDHLDNYFRIRFGYNSNPFPDRRYQERRGISQRRSFADSLTSISSDHLNYTTVESEKTEQSYTIGPFYIDNGLHSVDFNGKNLELTCKEFKLFSLLAANIEHVFSADEIIQYLWPETARANKSDLYQYMHLLRKKVEKDPDNPRWILTIKGVGYKFNIIASDQNNRLNSHNNHKLTKTDI